MWSDEPRRDAFLAFLLAAKRATYAGRGDEDTVPPLLPGSLQLEHRDGDYLYRDVYFGMTCFAGQEVVSYRARPVWSMTYAGGVTPPERDIADTRAIYAFLRLALRQGTEAAPYRGPAAFSQGAMSYTNASSGDLEAFWGVEEIARGGQKVYDLRYAGGLLR